VNDFHEPPGRITRAAILTGVAWGALAFFLGLFGAALTAVIAIDVFGPGSIAVTAVAVSVVTAGLAGLAAGAVLEHRLPDDPYDHRRRARPLFLLGPPVGCELVVVATGESRNGLTACVCALAAACIGALAGARLARAWSYRRGRGG